MDKPPIFPDVRPSLRRNGICRMVSPVADSGYVTDDPPDGDNAAPQSSMALPMETLVCRP
jgi:hypothetical protein